MSEPRTLVLEAVKALLVQHAADVPAIVAGGQGRFVQQARAPYKAQGLGFSDDDLRDIYGLLRLAVRATPAFVRPQASA